MSRRLWLVPLLALLLVTGCARVAAPTFASLGAIAIPGGGGRVVGFIIGLALGLAVDYGITKLRE